MAPVLAGTAGVAMAPLLGPGISAVALKRLFVDAGVVLAGRTS
jgi:hypothetical protein